MKYYVYILECADGTFYTGVTKDLEKRIAQHNSGRGARYTRGRLPVTLIYHEESPNIKLALKRERQVRLLTKSQKRKLIESAS